MKTIKTIFSLIGMTLATFSSGQLASLQETTGKPDHQIVKSTGNKVGVMFSLADYNEEDGQIIQWVNHSHSRNLLDALVNDLKSDMVKIDSHANETEVIYEDIPDLEPWMTFPFENVCIEHEFNMEAWMVAPFEGGVDEQELEVEDWMIDPWILGLL